MEDQLQINNLNDFIIEQKNLIGTGSNGNRVFKIQHKTNGKFYALKKIFITTSQEQQCKNEISILKKINHPNIIKYYESFIQKNKLYLILEYASDGDLRTIISKHKKASKPLNESVILDYFDQITDSIEYIHEKKIIHRDIKPENVFLSKGVIKLGDFGISKELSNTCELAKSGVGTPYYVSPEICRGELYDLKTDIWSLGCLLYELCSFQRPFVSKNINALMMNIMKTEPKPLDNTLYSGKLIALIGMMMNKDQEKRPDIKRIKQCLYEIMKKPFGNNKKLSDTPKHNVNVKLNEENNNNNNNSNSNHNNQNYNHVHLKQLLCIEQEESKYQQTQPNQPPNQSQPQPQPSPSSSSLMKQEDNKGTPNLKYHSKLFSEKVIEKKLNNKILNKPEININHINLTQLTKDTNSSQHSSNTTLTSSMQSPLPEANGFIFSTKSISNPEIKQKAIAKNDTMENNTTGIDYNKFQYKIKKRCTSKSVADSKEFPITRIGRSNTLTTANSNQIMDQSSNNNDNSKEHRRQLMKDFLLNKFGLNKTEQLLIIIKENKDNEFEYEEKIISLIGEDEYKKSIKYLKFVSGSL